MAEIRYIERASREIKSENVPGYKILKWLYSSLSGTMTLNLLFKRKIISAIGGMYMNTRWSAKRIPEFIEEHGINLAEYEISKPEEFRTFNTFFYRKLKPGARPIGNDIISPADGKILVFQNLRNVPSFFVKDLEFSLETFLRNKELAQKYADGAMAIIRLAPPDYHRYHFPAAGIALASVKIKGNYFSVSPLALKQSLKIFGENKREYCTLQTKDYGDILIADVGATMVGSIIQTYKPNAEVKKGDEKGYFAFGGSTLVLLFEKGKIQFEKDLIENTGKRLETTVKMGETIARKPVPEN